MVHGNQVERVLAFGPFRFRPLQRVLEEGGRPVRLGSRALELLSTLLSHSGEAVTKGELMARVWPDSVVEEATLRVHVATLRKALRDGRNGARYIQNITGIGYRFIATVSELDGNAAARRTVPPPALKSPGNLPTPLARMIGRADSLARITRRLPRERLITIVGPGGIGKTALALAAANTLAEAYADGVYFVDLASVTDPQLVPNTFAAVFGHAVLSDDPLPGLIASLRDKRVLIVLDNCEHVILAAATLAEKVLRRAPNVHLLATSREPLRAEGERVHRLAPLEAPPPAAELSIGEALGYPAIELFAERALESLDSFELQDADIPIVSDLCRKLDGIPLAIELMAARVDLLGIRGLAEHMRDEVRRLPNSRRAVPPRHRTLEATLDWSYSLLSDTEQRILRRFAVFAGGFDLASARAIVSDATIGDADVLNGILSLGAKSLLSADVSDDEVTYRLLETTRAYARERLFSSDESAEISRRHAAFFCDVCVGVEAHAQDNAEWLRRHGRKIDDVRAALDWCFSPEGDIVLGLQLTVTAAPLWFRLYIVKEYEGWLRRALDAFRTASMPDAKLDMRLTLMLGYTLTYMRGPEAAAAFSRASKLAERLGDRAVFRDALFGLGSQSILSGDYAKALRCSQRVSLVIDSASVKMAAAGENMTAISQHFAGNLAVARHRAERALSFGGNPSASIDPEWCNHRLMARATLSHILWVLGLPDQAAKTAGDALEDFPHASDPVSLAYALQHACAVALWTGDLAAAEHYVVMALDQAARHSLAVGDRWARSFVTVLAFRRGTAADKIARRDEMLSNPICDWPFFETLATLDEDLVHAEVIARAENGRAGWCAAEILRANAAVKLRNGALDAAAAETQFRRALNMARRQDALSWELRAATSLARLWRDQGRTTEAHHLLMEVYRRFTEGFGTADLVAAKTLLKELSASRDRECYLQHHGRELADLAKRRCG
jgi:predicted ATPase/DNA-binding winged helix-turn-helix (wHTH) protein